MLNLTLDFETFYGKGYSLTNLTYAQYVTHPSFYIQGVGVKLDDKPTQWISGRHMDSIRAFLNDLRNEQVRLICHNTMFDGYILHRVFDWHPTVYADTQGISRALWPHASSSLAALAERLWPDDPTMRKGKELVNFKDRRILTEEEEQPLATYCTQDVDLTWAAYQKLASFYPQEEAELIDLTLRMFLNPKFRLDVDLVEQHKAEQIRERDAKIRASSVAESTLTSNAKFARLLEKRGIEVPMKVSPTTGKLTPALAKGDVEFQEMMERYPEHDALWQARIAAKSVGEITRCDTFLREATLNDGWLPVPLIYYSAHTGRYGGTQQINLQNLKRKSPLRRALKAPDGHVAHVSDSSNIEARALNWFAGNTPMLRLFADPNIDVYATFASEHIYHRPINKNDNPVERFVGKVAVLGLGYGMGAEKFRDTLRSGAMGAKVNLTLDEARRIVYAFRNANRPITKVWAEAEEALVKMATLKPGEAVQWRCLTIVKGGLILPNGMPLMYPDLRADVDEQDPTRVEWTYQAKNHRAKLYGGKVIENIIQALARIVLFTQMLKIDKILRPLSPYSGVALNVHDEIVGIAPDMGSAGNDELHATITETMKTPPEWAKDLPLDSEGGWDVCYSK